MTRKELKQFMEQEEWTTAGLAMLLDVHERTVRRYVNGAAKIPRVVDLAIRWLVLL